MTTNDIPSEIKDLLTEACALEYCPAEFREWAASVLATGADPPTRARISSFSWRDFRTYLTWAANSRSAHSQGYYLMHARNYLDTIKREHDNSRTKSPDH